MKTRFILLALCVLFTHGVCHEDAEFPGEELPQCAYSLRGLV